jgi:hypothetical protein
MNTKITFLLLLILLVILMLFYYADIESNIIILLAVTIVVLIHNVITKREHFSTVNEQTTALESKIDMLLTIVHALKNRTSDTASGGEVISPIAFNYSCPFDASGDATESQISTSPVLADAGIRFPFGTSFNDLTPDQLLQKLRGGATSD